MRINNNISALRTFNAIGATNRGMQKTIQKLSSGLRINSAADDAAGLAISEGMRSQIRGLDQAIGNSQDGINMIQTAEGGLSEVHSILQRMRELSVNAANDTLTSNDREAIQLEIGQLTDEIDSISDTTQFNRKKLLNGDVAALTSTDDLNVKVTVKGGLRTVDQFGEKSSKEGNYKVEAEAISVGKGQILKSNIFKVIDHTVEAASSSGMGLSVSSESSISTGSSGLVARGSTKLYDVDKFWDSSGKFMIDDPQTIRILQGDGKEASVTLYKDDTIGDLSEKLSKAILSGLGQGDEDSYSDLGGGGDTSQAESSIVNGLKSGWLEASAKRIKDYYGMDASTTTYSENMRVNILTDAPYGTLAMASSSYAHDGSVVTKKDFVLNLDTADFSPATGESGVSRQVEDGMKLYDDRIVAHEMVHMLVGATVFTEEIGTTKEIPTWMNEGLAEFIHGADERFINLEKGLVNGLSDSEIDNYISKAIAWDGSDEAYAGAYLMIRAIHQNGSDGESTTKNILSDIQTAAKDGLTDAELSKAITDHSGFSSGTLAVLQGEIKTWAVDNFKVGGAKEITASMLTNGDTGAIGGLDVSGGAALNAEDVIDESSATSSDQPLSSYGWTVTYPTSSEPTSTWESAGSGMAVSSSDPMVVRGGSGYTPSGDGISYNSVNGTLVVHSGVVGRDGELSFAGDEDILTALGFNELLASEDSRYSVTVSDAHSGDVVAADVEISGTDLVGVLHPNVDVSMGTNAGIKSEWDSSTGRYVFEGGRDNTFSFDVHLADNTMVLQVGANEKEDMAIDIGDMSASALGVGSLQVIDREHATRSISLIDIAMERVSQQRGRLGASQKRLEHGIRNLNVLSTNLTESESRIRDVDMSQEMMKFTKLNIYIQSGTSMLSQANQWPKNILQLLR